MPARGVCLVTLSLSETGPGHFGGWQSSANFCHTIPCHAMPYHAIPYHTIPYHTMPLCLSYSSDTCSGDWRRAGAEHEKTRDDTTCTPCDAGTHVTNKWTKQVGYYTKDSGSSKECFSFAAAKAKCEVCRFGPALFQSPHHVYADEVFRFPGVFCHIHAAQHCLT